MLIYIDKERVMDKISQASDEQIQKVIESLLENVYIFVDDDGTRDMLIDYKVASITRNGEEVEVQLQVGGIEDEHYAAFTFSGDDVDFHGSIAEEDEAELKQLYKETLQGLKSKEPGEDD